MKLVQKDTVVKGIRKIGLLCIVLIGLMAIVGSDSDDAKDLVNIDFEEEAEFVLDAVTVDNNQRIASAVGDNCGTTSVKAEIKKVEDDIEDLDKIDVKSVVLRYMNVSYAAQWFGPVTSLNCRMTIAGDENTTLAEMVINNTSGMSELTLTEDQKDVINYYLANRSKEFTYCVECDNDDLIDNYTVAYTAELGVTIKGEF